MKSFFKSLLASIIGCSIVIGLLCLVFFIILAAMSADTQYTVKDNTVLNLKLNGILKERIETKNPLMDMFLGRTEAEIGMDDIIASIKKARENDKIKGIYINVKNFYAAPASLKEIRDELKSFKKSGKFIVSYADVYTQGAYYLSTVSDKMVLNQKGMVDLHGLSAEPTFYKGLLDKLGIEIQVFKVGTFKSAVEPYIMDKMSDANRLQVKSYLDNIWSVILNDISESRKISVEKLNNIADEMPLLKQPDYYLANNMVDTLMYESDMKDYLKLLSKTDKDVSLASVDNMTTVPYSGKKGDSNNVVAVLYAQGSITNGSGNDGITDGRFVKEITKLKDNDKVKAVVFRVNSGGGSASASEQIWKAIVDLKAKKPVVVSMGDYAASGGYYISCEATKIIAQPNTLTGSIGIFGMFPNVKGLSDKFGLTYDNVKTNKFADFGDMTRPMRDEEKSLMQSYINNGYDLFLSRCSDGRNIAKDSLALIAEGRVWTGEQAVKLGLVDDIGGIDKAVKEAAKLAELDDFSVRDFPKKVDFFETLLNEKQEEVSVRMMKEYLGEDYKVFQAIREFKHQDYMQARIPYGVKID